MTDSVIVIRIAGLGLGDFDDSRAVALTSRPIQYGGAAKIEGVVSDLGDQLSSEITLFGSMGSDATTSFSILANAETMPLLLARGKIPVKDADGASVVAADYIKPLPVLLGDTVISVSDTTNIAVDDLIRIGTTVFKVTAVNSGTEITGRRWYNCANVPIPMARLGTGTGTEGQTVYNVNANRPSGGAESLPVTISTVPFDAATAAEETVIFRGIVNKVTLDTSAGGQNQIRIECGSLMAFLKAAAFSPPQGPIIVNTANSMFNINDFSTEVFETTVQIGLNWNQRLYGVPFRPLDDEVIPADTMVQFLQVRNGGDGGISRINDIGNSWYWDSYGIPHQTYSVEMQTRFTWQENGDGMSNGSYMLHFRDGYYSREPASTENSNGPTIAGYLETVTGTAEAREHGNLRNVRLEYSSENLAEPCFISDSIENLFIDLIFGSVFGDKFFLQGARAAGEAAWLPFDVEYVSDIIDIASLRAFIAGFTVQEIPSFSTFYGDWRDLKILPYKHDDAKTIGDILEEILKRLGGFLVCDNGRLVFGRWSASPDTPIPVNDSALASPDIRLSFDRNNCIQAVNVTLCQSIASPSNTKTEIPFVNIDLGIGAQGKTLKLGHFGVFGVYGYNQTFVESDIFKTATNLILRFSQAAATVEVQYRDAVADLRVGQQVALSSAYLPNAYGGLGVTAATGMVLKAARSWKTPTTSYSILLPGYLNPINRLSVISPAGRVLSKPSAGKVAIAPNDFTNTAAADGAPATDAAAFDYALQLSNTGAIPVQLLDEYGTPYSPPVTDYITEVAGNVLTCGNVAIEAKPNDIIVLDSSFVMPNIAAQWSAYLANSDGRVQGEIAFAYKWVR